MAVSSDLSEESGDAQSTSVRGGAGSNHWQAPR